MQEILFLSITRNVWLAFDCLEEMVRVDDMTGKVEMTERVDIEILGHKSQVFFDTPKTIPAFHVGLYGFWVLCV